MLKVEHDILSKSLNLGEVVIGPKSPNVHILQSPSLSWPNAAKSGKQHMEISSNKIQPL